MNNQLSNRWLNLAGFYFVIGVALGIGMGMSGDHHLFPLHAHVNLLGWVSMALFGLIVRQKTENKLFIWHFWLYNIGLPVMSLMLTLVLGGTKWAEPVLGMSSLVIAVAVLFFVVALWRTPNAQ